MIDYKKIIKNREFRLKIINLLRYIPDRPYIKMVYRIKTGKKLNLKNPKGFNEKLNWLKVNDRHGEYTDYVDKIKVRDYIKSVLGEERLFPVLGVWNSFDQIDFDALPDKFVLKCNHDSGSVKIIKNKNEINKKELKKFFDGRQKINSFNLGREYPYKEVEPKIYAEELMGDGTAINDYKFFCFDGVPKLMFVATDRDTDCKIDFYDMDFNHLDIERTCPQSGKIIAKPECFEEMKEISAKLSKGMKFVRIDLYEIDGKVYFGEMTFFPAGGFYLFHPDEWETKLGDLIKI